MTLICDLFACSATPTHIGSKGYTYCQRHALVRRASGYERTRALRPWEVRWLRAGRTLPSYEPKPMPKADLAICTGCGGTIERGEDCPRYGYGETHAHHTNTEEV